MIPEINEEEEEDKEKPEQQGDKHVSVSKIKKAFNIRCREILILITKSKYTNIYQDKVKTARMDLFFFILFPVLFTVFNVIYWIVFLFRCKLTAGQTIKTKRQEGVKWIFLHNLVGANWLQTEVLQLES